MMRQIVLIAAVALVAAGLAPRLLENVAASRQQAPAPVSDPAPSAAAVTEMRSVPVGPRTAQVQSDGRGQFYTEGVIDGRRVSFIADTGASAVALTHEDAARLGIHPAARDYTIRTSTANGEGRAAPVTLGMIEIGGVAVRNVRAMVMPEGALRTNLLGMTFLSRLRRFEVRDGRLVMEE
ncbi:MAG TPA: TIGR02281 family clan AA aspartic protease [Xanthobacteraceae bacterium]|nr:TIGR02281 family clan AA aspartic protease [Xanthobacteraceae bacterium]